MYKHEYKYKYENEHTYIYIYKHIEFWSNTLMSRCILAREWRNAIAKSDPFRNLVQGVGFRVEGLEFRIWR